MNTRLPREASGSSDLVEAFNTVLRCLRERTILPDPSVEITQTPNGVRIKAKGGKGGSGGSTEEPVWL